MDARIGERSDAVFANGYARGMTRAVATVLYRIRETRAGTPVAAWRRFLYWKNHAPVAQLDRALPSEGRGQGFESLRARQQSQHLSCCRSQCAAGAVRSMSA